jgi:glycosyltransferase involved in cell wall biosynthesis
MPFRESPGVDPTPPAPGDGAGAPLVNVLVRSMGRPGLQQALDSVAAQTQDDLEVIVVNASGQPHPPLPARCGRFVLRLVEPARPLPRAAAANAALDAASAPWLLFLDDDDAIDSHHVQRLLHAVRADTTTRVAYAGVRLLDAQGRQAGQLDEPCDARRLWLANYLPIHAVLFARSLVDEGCRFDERHTVYEDWDFWQQVARQHAMHHVPGLSATDRLVGDSGLSAQRDEALSLAQRQVFDRKWLPRLRPAAAALQWRR